jgi:hypothetical protein
MQRIVHAIYLWSVVAVLLGLACAFAAFLLVIILVGLAEKFVVGMGVLAVQRC